MKTLFIYFCFHIPPEGKKNSFNSFKVVVFLFVFNFAVLGYVGRQTKATLNCNHTRFGSKGVNVCVGEQRSRCREQRSPAPASFTPTCSNRLHCFLFVLPRWTPLSPSPLRLEDKQKDVELSVQLQCLIPAHVPLCLVFARQWEETTGCLVRAASGEWIFESVHGWERWRC